MQRRVAKAGAEIRILRIDVRATDLPELADARGFRVEADHRSWQGIEGLAGKQLSAVKIAELDEVTLRGCTFAHGLAPG